MPKRIWAAALLLASFAGIGLTVGQDLPDPAAGSESIPGDEYAYARRVLMNSASLHFDEMIAYWIGDIPFDALKATDHADQVARYLVSLEFLFPSSSNTFQPDDQEEDVGFASYTKPDAWKDFQHFREMSRNTVELAFDVSRAIDQTEFNERMEVLDASCDACHATYRTYGIGE